MEPTDKLMERSKVVAFLIETFAQRFLADEETNDVGGALVVEERTNFREAFVADVLLGASALHHAVFVLDADNTLKYQVNALRMLSSPQNEISLGQASNRSLLQG